MFNWQIKINERDERINVCIVLLSRVLAKYDIGLGAKACVTMAEGDDVGWGAVIDFYRDTLFFQQFLDWVSFFFCSQLLHILKTLAPKEPRTSQVIHCGKEAVPASDVICHVFGFFVCCCFFSASKQASKQWFYGIVVQGLKHAWKLQCGAAITT